MKTFYRILFSLFILSAVPAVTAQAPKSCQIDLPALREVPEGKYTVTLELKQLDGKPASLTLESRNGLITGTNERLGKIQSRVQLIGNGVFMVQLRGSDYVATQYWIFRPDGSADIKEIPDRGEKQTAVPQ